MELHRPHSARIRMPFSRETFARDNFFCDSLCS